MSNKSSVHYSTVVTSFPPKILMWETAVWCSPLFNWETEAEMGLLCWGARARPVGAGAASLHPSSELSHPWGLSASTVGGWNGDISDNLDNTHCPAWVHSRVVGFFSVQQHGRVGFFFNIPEVVKYSCQMLLEWWNTAVSLAGWEISSIPVHTYTQNQHVASVVCVHNTELFVLEDIPLKALPTSPPNTNGFHLLDGVFSLHCWSKSNNGQKGSRTKGFHSGLSV